MHDYFSFDYIPGEQTIFEGVSRVPPGCVMVIDGQNTRTIRYWDVPFEANEKVLPWHSYVERVRELLAVSVSRHLMSEVPLGVLLSGGMDSSAITAYAARQSSAPVKTFSIGFKERSFDELKYAEIVAKRFNTEHHEMVLTAKDVLEVLESHISYFDEPFADGAAIPTYYVCKLASEKVKVVLSGEGGDEVFAGYDTHAAYHLARAFRRVPAFVRNGLLKPLINLLPVSDKKVSFDFRAKRFIRGLSLSVPEAHLFWRIVLTESEKMSLYSDELRAKMRVEASERIFNDLFAACPAKSPLNRLLYIDSKVFLPGDLFVKNDRMSMAHSVEARVPMTDPDLVEFMGSVPPSMKIKGLRTKHLLREAMRGILPDPIIAKKKIGFDMPFGKWIKSELYEFMRDALSSQRLRQSSLFDLNYVERMIDDHVACRRNNARALWGLLNFALWYDAYM
jgi:asparagine synthase (glutamine-hydrolysing)